MGFYHHPSIGTFHLNEAAPSRVVPGPERHKWDSKQERGKTSTCTKCGCRRIYQRDYQLFYRITKPTTGVLLTERPPCAPPPAPLLSAATAAPDAAPAPPYPTSLPGLTTTTYDEPAPYHV